MRFIGSFQASCISPKLYLLHLTKVRFASGGDSSLCLPASPRVLSGQGQSSFNIHHFLLVCHREDRPQSQFVPQETHIFSNENLHRVLSPVFTSAILLFLSGIPLLEEKVKHFCFECLVHFSKNRTNKGLKTNKRLTTIEPTLLRRTTSSGTIHPILSSSNEPHLSSFSPLRSTRPSPI